MKFRSILFCFLLFSVSPVFAQQDPYFSHFRFNRQSYNPASIASQDQMICLNAVSHRQWLGFDDLTAINRQTGIANGEMIQENVAPVTHSFNIYGPLYSRGLWSENWFGGLSFMSDKVSSFETFDLRLQLAHKWVLNRRSRLSVGASLGLHQEALVRPKFIFRQPNDPRIPLQGVSVSDQNADLSIGAYFQQRRLGSMHQNYIGLSVTHVTEPTYQLNVINFQQKAHAYLVAGSRLPILPLWTIEPSLLIRYGGRAQFELNTSLVYQSLYRLGLSYRKWSNADAVVAMIGYQFNKVQIGYSYDLTVSQIGYVSSGTHELMLSYCIPLEYRWFRNTRWL